MTCSDKDKKKINTKSEDKIHLKISPKTYCTYSISEDGPIRETWIDNTSTINTIDKEKI